MSFFSSLILFYPGRPPSLKLEQLRTFCDRLRKAVLLGDVLLAVDIKYGKSIDQDEETTSKIDWDETGTMGHFAQYDWDHEKRALPWADLWPRPTFNSRNVYRSFVGLGSLPRPISDELTAMRDRDTAYDFIAPDAMSLEIDPVCPKTLSSDELTAYGFIEVSFAGNGYFTWQPLADYWRQVRTSPTLDTVSKLCRDSFPVPRLKYLDELKSDMGELFLNRDEYQDSDWVISVSETG